MPDADADASVRPVMQAARATAVDLYWIPLGAGGHCVRLSGRAFEAIAAARRHRHRCDLYHAALVVALGGDRYAIELAPSPDADGASRGVLGTGAVGSRLLGWSRLFRYEVRCWRGGSIPDLAAAIGGPQRLTADPRIAARLLDLVTAVPRPVWGRDELDAGEMWNSNSMIAWLIATAGLSTAELQPPARGRAPGWDGGLEAARRGRGHENGRTRSSLTPPEWKPAAGVWRRADGDGSAAEKTHGMSSSTPFKELPSMSRSLRLAGITAGLVLIAFGVGAIVIGLAGRSEVSATIKQEQIVGSPDMTPALTAVAVKEAGLKGVDVPTCDVAGKAISSGSDAKCFASYMRIHALEATGGKTYAQMAQYASADGKGTSDKAQALKDPKTGGPQSNPARQIWISETALGTALNTSYFAASVGMFAVVMGTALLLTGVGFIVLASGLLGPAGLRRRRTSGSAPFRPAPVA
jgi:hypothetical protein